MRTRFATAWFLSAFTLAQSAAAADAPPLPPCAGQPSPEPAALGAAPVVSFWAQGSLGADWVPPACSGWRALGFQSLIAISGRFRLEGGDTALLTRIGAVSKTVGLRYWSITSKSWKTLVEAAHAGVGTPRGDFGPSELTPGMSMNFTQTDNGAGAVAYQLTVLARSAHQVVLEYHNITAERLMFVTLFHPNDLETLWVFDHEGTDVWRSYSLTRIGAGENPLATGHGASAINRAVAFWRFFAGVPSDIEPPAAP